MAADWDLLLLAALDGGVTYVDEPLVGYRVHASNMSRDVALMERDLRYAFAKSFANPRLPAAVRARRHYGCGRLHRMLAGSYRDQRAWMPLARSLALAIRHDPALPVTELTRSGRRTRAR